MKTIVRTTNGKIIAMSRNKKVLDYKRRKQTDFITSLMREAQRINYQYC